MEENKNQTGLGTHTAFSANGIIVKDLDGKFKIASDGELKELDSMLASTAVAGSVAAPEAGADSHQNLGFPKFTDLVPVPADEHFKATVKMPADENAQLHFHPEDQHELERELEKINTIFSLAPQKKYSVMKIAQKLADKHAVRLSENELRLLTNGLLAFFRQTRNSVQTRAILVDPKPAGGLGLANDTADHIIAIAKHLKHKIEESDGTVVDDEVPEPETAAKTAPRPDRAATQSVPSMPSISASPQPQKPATGENPAAVVAPPKPAQPASAMPKAAVNLPQPEQKTATPVPSVSKKPVQFFVDEPQEQSQAQSEPPVATDKQQSDTAPTPKVTRPATASKPLPLAEVTRPEPRVQKGVLTGRIEELAMMDLETWRMLDPDPRIRAGKILGKLQYLEQESLTRKSQGIEAWRNNEVYRHYLELGQQSLEQKKNVRDIIAEMGTRNVRTLTLDEFEAISDLNRMLRF